MKKNNILSGALVLSVGGVLAKIFSAIYRIALTRILGGEGIGIYQLIFPFYSLCVVLATAGLPMAISKVISKNKDRSYDVLKRCLFFATTISLVLTFILFITSKKLAQFQCQPKISICYIVLAPTIIVVSVASVLRGYFQGKHNFIPSAVSNIIEQFVKLCVGLALSVGFIGVSIFASVVGAVVGIVVSEVLSLIILIIYIKNEKFNKTNKVKLKTGEILKDVLPITLTNIILPISNFIDSVVVVRLLSINFPNKISIFLYGLESGAVSSLIGIPTIFSFAIASVVLPNIANLKSNFSKSKKLSLAIKIILILTVPCALCFVLAPNRLIEMLYQKRLNAFGINGVKIAARLLAISGLGIVFFALNQVYSSSLQAIEERMVTVRNLTISVLLKFVIELLFLPSMSINIYSLAVANIVCYVCASMLNCLEIKENFKIEINYLFWGKLALANVLMIITFVLVLSINASMIITICAVLLAVIIYFTCLLKTKILSRNDMAMFRYKV